MVATYHDTLGIPDPVADSYREALSHLKPEVVKPNAVLPKTQKYMFRTRPGTHRSLAFRIPGVPLSLRLKEKVGEVAVRQYERKYTEAERARFQRISEALDDGLYLRFTRVPNRHECYFETSDEDVAAYLRTGIARAGQPGYESYVNVFEDISGMMIRSKYTDDQFQNTPEGQAALYAHDRLAQMRIEEEAAKVAAEAAVAAAAPKPPK